MLLLDLIHIIKFILTQWLITAGVIISSMPLRVSQGSRLLFIGYYPFYFMAVVHNEYALN